MWEKISNLGIDAESLGFIREKKYRLLNRVCLGLFLVLSLILIFSLVLKWKIFFNILLIILILCSLLSLFLNYRKRQQFSQIIILLMPTSAAVALSMLTTHQQNNHYYLILGFFLPFLLLTPKENRLLKVMTVLNISCFVLIFLWYQFSQPILASINPDPLYVKYFILFGGLLAMLTSSAYFFYSTTQKAEMALEIEKDKTDKILKNILPVSVVDEIKLTGKVIPRSYEKVSVLFTDFVGFTSVAEKMSPGELVQELDLYFSQFDEICKRYHLEKIKTIGDSYMCAGGIPDKNVTNAIDTICAAIEIRSLMLTQKNIRKSKNLPYWNLRIGIHTGPLVAGVIGNNRYTFDVWGDTVNIASRME
ncbi:MAG: adenylate/guanylate cyclase domain-containing protein, partial [Leptospiraceae bacterium]|nr:adenylate/guanylate cyclase domain-containing protein [Leptospiraceae bacterium]